MACIDVPSWWIWTTCATSVGSRYHLMLPAVTLTQVKCKTTKKQSEKNEERNNVRLQNHSCFWDCLIVAFLVHLLISLTTEQLTLISKPLCCLTDQINTLEI